MGCIELSVEEASEVDREARAAAGHWGLRRVLLKGPGLIPLDGWQS